MMPEDNPLCPTEADIQQALETLDWKEVHRCFCRPLNNSDIDFLTQQILLSNKVVVRYSHAVHEQKRDRLLADLAQHALTGLGDKAAGKIFHITSVIRLIEHGYRILLSELNDSLAGTSAPEIMSATLIGAAAQIHGALETTQKQTNTSGVLDSATFSLRDANGTPYSADDLIEVTDASTAMIVVAHAHRAAWIDRDDAVVLPALTEPTEDHFKKFVSLQRQAEAWLFWRSTEERRRFEGGALEWVSTQKVGDATDRRLIRYTPTSEALASHQSSIAGYGRLSDEIASILSELAFRSKRRTKAKGFNQRAKFYPTDFVSLSELGSASALDLMLTTSIESDRALYMGLRLVEWLRGYSALALLVNHSYRSKTSAESLLVKLAPQELYRHLSRLGFTERKAKHFVDLVTFRKMSTEIVDDPIFRMSDGHYLVFGPSLVGAIPARILLSKLARANIHLEDRGRRFETSVKHWFQTWGLEAKSFKVRRGHEVFEYDAVVRWGSYIFVFECKSQGLVAPNTIHRYRAQQRLKVHTTQIKRLIEALVRHPEILDAQFGKASSPRTIVPCLLNAMPFGVPGIRDGVYCTDAPALGCFFGKGAITLSATETMPRGSSIQHILGKKALWSGSIPTPEDFVAYLQECPLHALAISHLETIAIRIPIGGDIEVESPQIFAKPVSLLEKADLLGGDVPSTKRNIEALASRQSEQRLDRNKT